MTFRIHFTLPDGSDDSVIVEGETVEEIRAQADVELAIRGGTDSWSEEL